MLEDKAGLSTAPSPSPADIGESLERVGLRKGDHFRRCSVTSCSTNSTGSWSAGAIVLLATRTTVISTFAASGRGNCRSPKTGLSWSGSKTDKISREPRLPGRLRLQFRQPVFDGAKTALHAHDVDVGAAIRDDALVQLQRAAIIVGGLLDLVLLLRQTAHVARVPP